MKNFDTWYLELLEDQMWYEMASRNHTKGTFEATALKVYTLGISDSQSFFIQPMKEHRNHVYNKLCKLPPDKIKKNWHEIALEEKQQEEAKNKKPEEPPLVRGSEQYLKRTQELIDAIQGSVMMSGVPPLTAKERIEGQNLRPKPESIREPSQEEKIAAARSHFETAQKARAKMFREKFPDGTPKELREYLKRFKSIDNPFNL